MAAKEHTGRIKCKEAEDIPSDRVLHYQRRCKSADGYHALNRGPAEQAIPQKQTKLSCNWTWWYYKPDSANKNDWVGNLHVISDISTEEEFWEVHNSVKLPSDLVVAGDYYFFKKNIVPCWESTENEVGGRVLLSMRRSSRNFSLNINECWFTFVSAMVNGHFAQCDHIINGAFFASREGVARVGFWLHSKSTDEEKSLMVAYVSDLVENKYAVVYQPHNGFKIEKND